MATATVIAAFIGALTGSLSLVWIIRHQREARRAERIRRALDAVPSSAGLLPEGR